MMLITSPVFLLLAIFALRGARWAYATFVVLGLVFFAARVGFELQPQACELACTWHFALLSFTNYWHIALFTGFFLLSHAQFRELGERGHLWSALATLIMGALVELAEGLSGSGHCRLRDLIPDSVGAALGLAMVLTWQKVRARWASNE